MPRRLSIVVLVITAVVCVVASYGLRYLLMEGDQWVGRCVDDPANLACQVRATLGWMIHLRIIAWAALGCAVLAFVLPGAWGWRLAVPGLLLGLPALALYTASLAVFAVVLSLLRLVRAPASTLG
ncbi:MULTISPECIES: hypothetical protein [Pseudomonas]|uniref:Uncharacterized protein n=2 Tax=Pseudomonadaceae TaxID=135621 RepID=A0A0D0KF84_9PSED|nr:MULTISPECIES: hypothetical protein [Pseudomonas]KIP96724.1 hypothetical protein RU08_20990 [Pseudomonas fulva]MCW2292053.1 hypothetical protein [Pseudomonas sp. BIGb0408]NYH73376.1 hypothetical protein [Pseudomonas flavescens]